jgi:hypothetical protein
MMAQAFGTAADLFGDVPFTEAADPAKYPAPKFDKQSAVYAGVQTLLDNAIANLSSGVGVNPGGKDIFYAGSASKWIKAAYTLKARFYLHVKDYPKAITAAALGINNPTDNMIAKHGTSYNSDFNLYYSFCVYDRDSYMGADDAIAPRLLDAATGRYRGNAKTDEEARFNFLYAKDGNIGYHPDYELNILCDFDWGTGAGFDGFFGGESAFPLVTFEENKLTLAEASIRNSDFATALTALNDFRSYMNSGGYIGSGYVASYGIEYLPYVAADFATGGMENFGLSQNQALLKEIIEERYITFIGQIEQFNDVRRTKNAIGLTPVTDHHYLKDFSTLSPKSIPTLIHPN